MMDVPVKKNDFSPGALIPVFILAGAIAVRLTYIIQLSGSNLEGILPLDMRFYRDLAAGIAGGEGLPEGGLSFNPLYPLFLALIFRLAGEGLLVPRLLQMTLGIVTIFLHYRAGNEIARRLRLDRVDPRTVGTAAALMALLYPHFLFYEGSVLGTSLVTLIFVSSLYLTLIIDRRIVDAGTGVKGEGAKVSISGPFALGLVMGLGAAGRPNLFFILIAAVTVFLFFRARFKAGGRRAAIGVLAGASMVLAAPLAYNASQTGRFVPVTSHGGINFYIGNVPGARGFYKPPPGMRGDMRGLVEDARRRAEGVSGRELTDEEASRYWLSAAVDSIARDPWGWGGLLGRKFMLFWNRSEIPDVIDISFYRRECPVMKVLLLPFSLISVLALSGFVALLSVKALRGVFGVFIGSALMSVLIFYVNSRYRVPSVPALILSASVFITLLADRAASRNWKEVAAGAFLVPILFFSVVNRDMVKINRSAMYGFLGNEYSRRGEDKKALNAFREAYRLDAGNVEAEINYARALMRSGDLRSAIPLYQRAFKAFPDYPRLAIEFGAALEKAGEGRKAERLFMYAYENRDSRERFLACKYLSRAAIARGDRDGAIMWVKRALEIVPGDKQMVETLHLLEGP